MSRRYNQVVSATVQNVMRVDKLLTESRRWWGDSPEDTDQSRALTHTSYGKTVRPQASLLTSLEPQFFHLKKWENQETYGSVGMLKLNNSDTASHGSWYRVSSR